MMDPLSPPRLTRNLMRNLQDDKEPGFWIIWFSSTGFLVVLEATAAVHFEYVSPLLPVPAPAPVRETLTGSSVYCSDDSMRGAYTCHTPCDLGITEFLCYFRSGFGFCSDLESLLMILAGCSCHRGMTRRRTTCLFLVTSSEAADW